MSSSEMTNIVSSYAAESSSLLSLAPSGYSASVDVNNIGVNIAVSSGFDSIHSNKSVLLILVTIFIIIISC